MLFIPRGIGLVDGGRGEKIQQAGGECGGDGRLAEMRRCGESAVHSGRIEWIVVVCNKKGGPSWSTTPPD